MIRRRGGGPTRSAPPRRMALVVVGAVVAVLVVATVLLTMRGGREHWCRRDPRGRGDGRRPSNVRPGLPRRVARPCRRPPGADVVGRRLRPVGDLLRSRRASAG